MTWIIKDTETGLYLTAYSTSLEFCSWGNPANAVHFSTQEQATDVIATWGDTGSRFIGTNPPPR